MEFFEKLTSEELMSYIKFFVTDMTSGSIPEEVVDEMTTAKVRPKKGGYRCKVTIEFDVDLIELQKIREQFQMVPSEE